MQKIDMQILQIGTDDWSTYRDIPENMGWNFFWPQSMTAIRKVAKMQQIRSFDGIIVQDMDSFYDLMELRSLIEPYTVFFDQDLEISDPVIQDFQKKICAVPYDFSNPEETLRVFSKALFRGQYGDKLFPVFMTVSPNFKGIQSYNGYENLALEGDFGEEFTPTIQWSYNIRFDKSRPVELWLEYEKDPTCEIQLSMRLIPEGSVFDIAERKIFSEKDLESALVLDYSYNAMLAFTLEVRGQGRLAVGNLHQRFTRFSLGKFLLGGQILHDERRDEINCYFHPGDFKPPLNVYFSGFRPAEGFEGYFMMRSMGAPFILISDPRLEGGAFYLGSETLEQGILSFIQEKLDYLGFTNKELILSGMSMGTYPAVFYGADLQPHAVIVAKLLSNLGTIAQRGRLLAPNVFSTGFDVLKHHTGGRGHEEMTALDQRYWDKVKAADFKDTAFGISYMKDEDMDPTAYQEFRDALYFSGAKIMSKGTAGRHNDDTATATNWFLNFYKMILENDFGRG